MRAVDLEDQRRRQRARAIAAYSGKDYKELADLLEIKYPTFRGWLAPKGRKTPSLEILLRLADLCKVPRWFVEHGFEGGGAQDDLASEISRLREAVGSLSLAVLRQEQELVALRDTDHPPGQTASDG